MSYNYLFDSYKNVVDKSKKQRQQREEEVVQGLGLRWIINIEREGLSLVKKFLEAGINVRHIKNMLRRGISLYPANGLTAFQVADLILPLYRRVFYKI